ncbi:MAG TPA: TonB-dependent receptor [Thermoanaerobaculia bacterium]|nr:TonB-dependent receptor [Thermoanaerobaculia bacterium]
MTGSAFAQSTTGTIQVIVTDASGAPLPGVSVTASAVNTTTRRTEVTSAEGTAVLVQLEPSNNYVVEASLEGFGKAQTKNVLVRSAQQAQVRITLTMAAVSDSITVTADAPIVDTTSATVGQELTLELTESLPTGRTYQSYLQLVPGVLPSTTGNPASRSGVNYSDIGGAIGQSSDNFYYVEGINVTDPVTGTFGANLNTEIIQEQKVLTGGIPAEFAGAPGLLSSVVTKSGSNEFSGSVNYYTQDDSLVADNEHQANATFSSYDTAITLGGPIVRDKAWFFGSYRLLNTETDVVTNAGQFLRTVENDGKQAYGKLSWQFTSKDRISGTFTNDPTDISGSTVNTTLNTRSSGTTQGGDRYSLDYNRVFNSNFLVDAAYGKHNGELSTIATIQEVFNTVTFRAGDGTSAFDQQLGGAGANNINERDTEFMKATFEGFWDAGSFGGHTVKLGLENEDHINFRNNQFVGGAQYNSLGVRYAGTGITAGELGISGAFAPSITFNANNTSDRTGLLNTINAMSAADKTYFYDLLDLDKDGTITAAELGQYRFRDTTGNPNGQINYRRIIETQSGPQETETNGQVVYLQDSIALGRFVVNAGIRAERWEHKATTGANIFTFDWEYAPRLSVIYDILGNGRQKVSGYYGRYYDPIRLNLTNFAGTLTGQVLEEQVFIGGRWVKYRTRGGAVEQDAFFAPTTKTPYTDELQFGYQIDLGHNLSFESSAYRRQTRDIIEDFDLTLYTDPAQAGDFTLPLSYFGYDSIPPSNFVIATLPGGERNTDGLDLVFRKRYANNWQALASYSFTDAEGNNNSDSNADFVGDVLFLDPRAPNVYGTQPGSIDHLFKFAGSYMFFDRLEVGAVYAWNSGAHASRTAAQSGRNLPLQVSTPYVVGGISDYWVADNTVGNLTNPSYGTLDLRAQWNQPLPAGTKLELFVDLFNALNDQAVIREQDLVSGASGIAFGEPLTFVQPRRFYLGARFMF